MAQIYGGRWTLVCDTAAVPFFRAQFETTRMIAVSHVPGKRRVFDATRAAEAVGTCDLFLSLVPWTSGALEDLERTLAAKLSIGFGPFFDVPLPRDYDKHSSDLVFDVVHRVDPSLQVDHFSGAPQFDRDTSERADRLVEALPPEVRLLSVHADTLVEKEWTDDRMVDTIRMFLATQPNFFVLVVGLRSPAKAEAQCRPYLVDGCGLPLDVSMRLVAMSDLFLGVDSCMLHVADLAGVPGVGLFGPTSSREFGFRFGPHEHLQELQMSDITPAAAAQALARLARAHGRRGSARRLG